MAGYLRRIQLLKSSVKSFFENSPSATYVSLQQDLLSQGQQSKDFGGDLEFVFRSILNDFVHNSNSSNGVELENTSSVKFVEFTTNFAVQFPELTSQFAKIPFLLIEDLFEFQSVENSKKLWRVVESLSEKLTIPNMFAKGKFTVLKVCNSLLRKLSRSCDTEFCGRILMFLAAIYPISERSAVNLAGKVNVGNITYFDDQSTFQSNMSVSGGSSEHKESEKLVSEDGEEVENVKSATSPSITYEIYEAFWKLQSTFASELKTFEGSGQQAWTEFMNLTSKVFETFETYLANHTTTNDNGNTKDGNSHEHATASEMQVDQGDEEKSNGDDNMGSKYLTSSQLFLLQLKDPLIRQQVALQILILVHFLRTKAIPVLKDDQTKANYEKEFLVLHDKAKELLEKSSFGNGKDLIHIIQRILEREDRWLQWKAMNCPAFEKLPTAEAQSAKRKFSEIEGQGEEVVPSVACIEQDLNEHQSAYTKAFFHDYKKNPCSQKCLFNEESIRGMTDTLLTYNTNLDEQIEKYIEADDPENGIEEDYHPKHDPVYSWRTRRLLVEKDISLTQYMQTGDLGRGIRKYKNLPEPLPPAPKSTVDEDDDDFFGEKSTKKTDKEDNGVQEAKDSMEVIIDEKKEEASEEKKDSNEEKKDEDGVTKAVATSNNVDEASKEDPVVEESTNTNMVTPQPEENESSKETTDGEAAPATDNTSGETTMSIEEVGETVKDAEKETSTSVPPENTMEVEEVARENSAEANNVINL